MTVDEKFRILGNDGKSVPKSIDARAWAIAFVYSARANPNISTDEGCMIGWFSNSIMAGYDAGKARAIQEIATISEAVTEALSKSPPTFSDYRKYQCEMCKGEATIYSKDRNWYFCNSCIEKIKTMGLESLT